MDSGADATVKDNAACAGSDCPDSHAKLTDELFTWTKENPKTALGAGLVIGTLAIGLSAKFGAPKILDLLESPKLLAQAANLSPEGATVTLNNGKALVRTFSDGSQAWYSSQRMRFGLKLSENDIANPDLQQKLSHLVNMGNKKLNLFQSRDYNESFKYQDRVGRIHDLLFKAETEEILPHMPSSSKYLGSGKEALVLSTKTGNALRIQPLGITERVDDATVLQAIGNKKGGNWQVEELPLVKPDNFSSAEVDTLISQAHSRGFLVQDQRNSNLGRTQDGRAVFVDPGCVFRPF